MQVNSMDKTLIALALEAGAAKAEYFPAGKIVLADHFREICRSNSCGRYDRCYMCPPDLGDIHDLMAQVRSYPHAVIYQTIADLEDPFDYEGMTEAGDFHAQCSGKLHAAAKDLLTGPWLHISTGCRLCARCGKLDGIPCRHPDQAIGSVSGYGIDVYQTVKDSGLNYVNGQNTVTYFGILFYKE